MNHRIEEEPLIVRVVFHLRHFERRPDEDDMELIHRWLRTSELGQQFRDYRADEAGLIDMAADRLNASGGEELCEIGRELGGQPTGSGRRGRAGA